MIENSISIISQVISVILGIFSTYIIFNFMSNFKRNIFYKRKVYILVYIIFTILIFLSQIYLGTGWRIVSNVILIVLLGHYFFNKDKIFIFYYCLFVAVMSSVQIIATVGFEFVAYYLNIKFYSLEVYINTISLIVQFANLSAVRLFLICFKNKKIKRFTKAQYLNFLILPLFSIFFIVSLSIYLQMYMSLEDMALYILNVIIVIVFNVFITNTFESISKNNELKRELSLYEQQSKMEYNYYVRLEEKYKESRKIIHDIKNHLLTIEALYKDGDLNKAEGYRQDIYLMLENLAQRKYSTNKVLNIVLNDKIDKAKKDNIMVECRIGEVNVDFIKDIDLTTIVSNIFDNAIDSAGKCKDNKHISFKMDRFNQFIIISLSNAYCDNIKEHNGRFKSTKKNHLGLGLENVRLAIEKYEGNLKINYDENSFKVNIIIPINI